VRGFVGLVPGLLRLQRLGLRLFVLVWRSGVHVRSVRWHVWTTADLARQRGGESCGDCGGLVVSRAKNILDVTVTVTVLAVCVVILNEAWQARHMDTVAAAAPAGAPAGPRVGDHVPALAGLSLAASPQTLVVALQSGCHFCSESMAFYRTLQQTRHRSVRLVVVMPDTAATAQKYMQDNGLAPDAIVTADLAELQVTGTPTLLLANAAGVIEQIWRGKLPPEREKTVLAAISGP